MNEPALAGLRIHVHAAGDRGIDGILRLIEKSAQNAPLEDKLQAMCTDASRIAEVAVVSVYVRERSADGDHLVMRGNVGFPSGSIGVARLRIGEGITGFVAECLRPVSAAVAHSDTHYKHIPGLGEERFPAFLGVPLVHGGASVGVLVFQRSDASAFEQAEVTLATALAAPFASAIDLERRRERGEPNGRSVRLRGLPVVQGAAMGRAVTLPSLTAADDSTVHPSPRMAAAGGLESLQRDLDRVRKQLRKNREPAVDRALANLQLVLSDHRFRDRTLDEVERLGLAGGLERVARDYARVPYVVSSTGNLQEVLDERARELEDLCVLIMARARDHRFLARGNVLACPRVGAFTALAAAARGIKAIASEAPVAPGSPGAAIASACGIPLVGEVVGLLAWIRQRDLMVVNARGGAIDINPSIAQVTRFRQGQLLG